MSKYVFVKTHNFDPETEATLFDTYEEACKYMVACYLDYYNEEVRAESDLDNSECICDRDYAKVAWAGGDYTEFNVIEITPARNSESTARPEKKNAIADTEVKYYSMPKISDLIGVPITREAFLKAVRTNDASDLFVLDEKERYGFVTGTDEVEYPGLFVLTLGYWNIELNLLSNYDEKEHILKPQIEYVLCDKISESDNDWNTYGYLGDYLSEEDCKCRVDWTSDDWEKQLKEDMEEKLRLFCKTKNFDYTKPC